MARCPDATARPAAVVMLAAVSAPGLAAGPAAALATTCALVPTAAFALASRPSASFAGVVAAGLAALGLAGCGATADVALTIMRSSDPAESPWTGASRVGVIVRRGERAEERVADYHANGALDLRVPAPLGDGFRVLVEVLRDDGAGSTVALGASPPLTLDANRSATARLYLGRVDAFSRTPMAPANERSGSLAAALPDGRVAFIGGQIAGVHDPTNDIDLYDPARGGFFASAGIDNCDRDDLPPAITGHAVAVLGDGRVLIVGGRSGSQPLDTPLVYDAKSGCVRSVAHPLPDDAGRTELDAVALTTGPNAGRVLLFGGHRGDGALATGAYLFDPGDESYHALTVPAAAPRASASATLLANGSDVLIAGGRASAVLGDAWLFRGATGVLVAVDNQLRTPHVGHTATLMGDGHVFVFGGSDGSVSVAEPQVYLPEVGQAGGFALVTPPSDLSDRELHAAVALDDGSVLIAGGQSTTRAGSTPLAELVRFRPQPYHGDWTRDPFAGDFLVEQSLRTTQLQPTLTRLGDGTALLFGGGDSGDPAAQLFVPCLGALHACPTPTP